MTVFLDANGKWKTQSNADVFVKNPSIAPSDTIGTQLDILQKNANLRDRLKVASHINKILPDAQWKWIWDIMLLCGTLFYGFYVPLWDVKYANWLPYVVIYGGFLWSFLFTIDLYLNFNMVYVHEIGRIEEHSHIVSHYLRGFFVIDLLAAVPFDCCLWWTYPNASRIVSHLRLLRYLRVHKLFAISNPGDMTDKYVYFHFTVVPILKLIFWALTLIHFFSILWMSLEIISVSATSYISALYWVLYTVATIGYGDVPVTTHQQRQYAIFMFLVGALSSGLIIANISTHFLKSDISAEKTKKMQETLAVMRHFNIPHDLQREVLAFQHHILEHTIGAAFAEVVEALPLAMQEHVALYIRIKFIEAVPLFHHAPAECKIQLAKSLKSIVVQPEDLIISAGDDSNEMFFMGHGIADVILPDMVSIATIKKGGFFGEIAMLTEIRRTASIKALTFCDLFRLDKVDFRTISQQFSEFMDELQTEANSRLANADLPFAPPTCDGSSPSLLNNAAPLLHRFTKTLSALTLDVIKSSILSHRHHHDSTTSVTN
jgi:voltage-gated potassium channel